MTPVLSTTKDTKMCQSRAWNVKKKYGREHMDSPDVSKPRIKCELQRKPWITRHNMKSNFKLRQCFITREKELHTAKIKANTFRQIRI